MLLATAGGIAWHASELLLVCLIMNLLLTDFKGLSNSKLVMSFISLEPSRYTFTTPMLLRFEESCMVT